MPQPSPPARLLWDSSGLWGLMALESTRLLGLPLEPITVAEIIAGHLQGARLLVAPGGWPALKLAALGPAGVEGVRAFVNGGGCYLGFCGGAGLALAGDGGLGLLPLGRDRGGGRLPSASGPIQVSAPDGAAAHALWRGMDGRAVFHVWFPGQFARPQGAEVDILAVYDQPMPLFHCADVAVGGLDAQALAGLERQYGLRLDPGVLLGQPAVIGARFGAGKVIASYPHLDTTGDGPGGLALQNLWRLWAGIDGPAAPDERPAALPSPEAARLAAEAWDLWQLGADMGLWRARHPVMPLWRRGARGLEFWSLTRMLAFVARHADTRLARAPFWPSLVESVEALLRDGPTELAAQAALLVGRAATPAQAALHEQWFPAPRRMGGGFKLASDFIERAALLVARRAG